MSGQIDKEIQCPYVPSHILREGTRLQRHLAKCRENIRKDTTSPFHKRAMEIEICRFNSCHHIHRSKMDDHLRDCKDNPIHFESVDTSEDLRSNPALAWKREMLKANSSVDPEIEGGEDWDDEPEHPTYNPMEKVAQKPDFLFNPMGYTPSEKREFRKNQRLRANGEVIDQEIFRKEMKKATSKFGTTIQSKPPPPPPTITNAGPVSGRGRGQLMMQRIQRAQKEQMLGEKNSTEQIPIIGIGPTGINLPRERGRGRGRGIGPPPGFS